jgi:membrane protease YdiL (CAAX protease family)
MFSTARTKHPGQKHALPAPIWHFAGWFALGLLFLRFFATIASRLTHPLTFTSASNLNSLLLSLTDVAQAAYAQWGFRLTGRSVFRIGPAPQPARFRPSNLFLGLGLAVALLLINFALAASLPHHDQSGLADLAADGAGPWVTLILVVVASLCEELIFRGYCLQELLALTGSATLAVVLQALLFMLAHGLDQGATGYVDRLLIGLAFGWFALVRRSLVPSVIAHLGINVLVWWAAFFL